MGAQNVSREADTVSNRPLEFSRACSLVLHFVCCTVKAASREPRPSNHGLTLLRLEDRAHSMPMHCDRLCRGARRRAMVQTAEDPRRDGRYLHVCRARFIRHYLLSLPCHHPDLF